MKTDQEYVEEYRKKFLEATGTMEEEGLQLYCSRCSEDDSFYDWLLTTLKEVREAERKRFIQMIEEKKYMSDDLAGDYAVSAFDIVYEIQQTLTHNN